MDETEQLRQLFLHQLRLHGCTCDPELELPNVAEIGPNAAGYRVGHVTVTHEGRCRGLQRHRRHLS